MSVVANQEFVALRRTPFFDRVLRLNETMTWFAWGDFLVAHEFTSVDREIEALRSRVVVADQTPLYQLRVSGPDAMALINQIATRDFSDIAVNQAYFTAFCDEHGHVVGDGPITRKREDEFVLSTDNMTDWVSANATGFDVELADETGGAGLLCIQGPDARKVLEAACGENCEEISFSHAADRSVGGVKLEVLRQGFTGELGYELKVPFEFGSMVWDSVWEAGGEFGLEALGHLAVLIARVEAGFYLVHHEFNPAAVGNPARPRSFQMDPAEHRVSPFELNLDRFVSLEKKDFIGRDALVREQEQGGPKRRLVGLEFDSDEMVAATTAAIYGKPSSRMWDFPQMLRLEPLRVVHSDEQIGWATSVTWSPTLRRTISFGRINRELTEIGTEVSVELSDGWTVPALVGKYPFVRDDRRG
jgi:aminomethyltransferase